jgi:hypothetical protein
VTNYGAATAATDYANNIGANKVVQNSWKAHGFFGPGFDPTVDATYDIYLAAYNPNGGEVARSQVQIIVGAGGLRYRYPRHWFCSAWACSGWGPSDVIAASPRRAKRSRQGGVLDAHRPFTFRSLAPPPRDPATPPDGR